MVKTRLTKKALCQYIKLWLKGFPSPT